MEDIPEKILALMRSKKYAPSTLAQIAVAIGGKKGAMPKIKKALAGLLKSGRIAKVKSDKFGLSSDFDLVSGVIDFRPSGWAFLTTDTPDLPEIEIRPEDKGVALTGDKVLCRILADSRTSAHGKGRIGRRAHSLDRSDKLRAKVIRILERKTDKVVGTLRRSYAFWHVVADNPKFFYDIIVEDPAKSGLTPVPEEDDKVVVRLNEWTQRHINPSGVIVEDFGKSRSPMAEYRAILAEHDLSDTFPEAVLREVENVPESVSAAEADGRLDLRNEFIITIDPEDAKDFDDAVSVKRRGKLFEIGIHIADVSHYVRAQSALDKEANKRGNSTYLVGTVIPMLPFALSNGICSLVEGEDRLVKSVFVLFDARGNYKGVRFANSVIRSAKRLSYEQAHALIVNPDPRAAAAIRPPADYETAFAGRPLDKMSARELEKLQSTIKLMWQIAAVLREKRFREGGLDLDMPEFKIFCNAEGYADRIEKQEYNESHQLVEEFMLAANEAVARALFFANIPYISRVHLPPEAEKLSELREELSTFGIHCGDLTERSEVSKVLAAISAHPQSFLLKTKFLRAMRRAEYGAEAEGHYGLNKQYYAHFTSPIRRYADLTVHRNLDFFMKKTGSEGALKANAPITPKAALAQTAAHISKTEVNSAEAERDSRKVKLLEFFERKIGSGESFEAIITSMSNHGFFVELTESMAYGFVHAHTLSDDIYRLNDASTALRGRRTGKIYSVGDRISVEVEAVDRFKRQIDFHPAGAPRTTKKSDTARATKQQRKPRPPKRRNR